MANLVEAIKDLSEHQKQYIVRRVAGLDTSSTRDLIGIARGTYNTWFHNEAFVAVHRQLQELSSRYKLEAIQILRRDNQLEAVILEGKIIARMKEEIDSGEYAFVRTNLAREVYSKLITDLDKAPAGIQVLSWQQRVNQIFPGREQGGEIINGEFEEVNIQSPKYSQGELAQASEQTHNEGQEETPS